MTEASNQRISIIFLELMEAASIQDSRENSVHIEGLLVIDWDDAVQVLNGVKRLFRLNQVMSVLLERIIGADILHNCSRKLNSMLLIICQMISNSRLVSVKMSTAKFFIRDNFTCGGLDKRRSTEEDSTFTLHDDDLIRHGWDVGSACRAGAHYYSDLRDTCCRHPRLVVKNLTKVILIGEYVVLLWQESTS